MADKKEVSKAASAGASSSNTLGVVGVILGALSFVFLVLFPPLSFVGFIAALVLGILQRKRNKSALGMVSIILGIIGLVISVLIVAGVAFIFAKAISGGGLVPITD